jgi:hypothetical protein
MLTIGMNDENKQTDRKQRNKCLACRLSRDIRIPTANRQIRSTRALTQRFSSKTRPLMLGRLGHIRLCTGTASTLLEYLFEDASNGDCGFLEDTKEGVCRLLKSF